MKQRKDNTAVIVQGAFLRVLPVQIAGLLVAAVNTFVDSVVTGNFLGTEAMAAIGFFCPISTVIGIAYVLITGIQIMCSRHIGCGERDQVVSLFSTGTVVFAVFSILLSLLCILFRDPLAYLLGAREYTKELLTWYIAGYAPGIIGQVFCGMLMVFLPLNNDMKRSYIGVGTMIAANIVLDLLCVVVFPLGIFGMGLATAVSYLTAGIIMFAGFVSQDRAVHFSPRKFCFAQMPKAAMLGLPNLLFNIGCTAKAYIMNQTLMTHIGDAAVAAMTVQGNICSIIGSIPQGCANAYLTLGSMYYGERDRRSLLLLKRCALGVGTALSLVAVVLLMAGASVIPSLFYPVTDAAWDMTRRMLLLFPSFLVFNTVFNLFMKTYQYQGRMKLVNTLSVGELLLQAALAVGFVGEIGADAIWLAFPFSEIICLILIGISVTLWAGKVTFQLPDWMKLRKDFGAAPEECMEFSVHSMEEVVNISVSVIDFCRERGVDKRRSNLVGLCVEEMVGNVVEHGFEPGRRHSVDVRVVSGDKLTIRIRDNCRTFDPKKRMEQFDPADPVKNVGIRMISRMAEEMNYQGSAGINTLLIKV